MKFAALITFLILFPIQALAKLNLPEPDELVKQASQGRIPLREVVFQIEKNIPEFTSLPELNKYLRILPELQVLSDKFKLDEIYPRGVARIGEYMFSAAIKWLDVRYVPREELLFFIRYSNYDLSFRFADAIESVLRAESNQSILATSADNIDAIRIQYKNILPDSPGVDGNFKRILSDLAVKYISMPSGITDEQINFWLSKLSNSSGFSSALDWIANKVAFLKPENAQDSHVYLSRLAIIEKRMRSFTEELGTPLFGSLSDQYAELLTKMIVLSVIFEKEEFENALTVMQAKSMHWLVQNLMAQQKPPSTDYIKEYTRIANLILAKLEELDFTQDVREFTSYVQRILFPANATLYEIEGQYAVVEPNGKKWTFTIIQARKNVFFASIGNSSQDIFKSYLNLTSDFVNGGFLASEREPDNDARHNFTARFNIDSEGNIEIQDFQSFDSLRTFKGKKSNTFPVYKATPEQPQVSSGRFAGVLEYLDGTKIKSTLDITVFPGYILGRLNLYNSQGKVQGFLDYGIGGKILDNTFTLTTGQMFSLNWNHLRGDIINNELRAVMIVGGKGVISKEFKFKRINNESVGVKK